MHGGELMITPTRITSSSLVPGRGLLRGQRQLKTRAMAWAPTRHPPALGLSHVAGFHDVEEVSRNRFLRTGRSSRSKGEGEACHADSWA